MKISFLDFIEDIIPIISLKWKISAHENIQEDSNRPAINLFAIAPFQDLRRHIIRGARHTLEHLTLLLNL